MDNLDFDTFSPNSEMLECMEAMGIERDIAKFALFNTGNDSCDAAISYIFDNFSDSSGAVKAPDGYKMVLVVNTALGMGNGKIGAQVGHACLGLYRELMKKPVENSLELWEQEGEKKVVLKGTNHTELLNLQKQAHAKGLRSYIVQDAGRTEVPAGSLTVLAIFGREDCVNSVTGSLELL